MDNDFKEYYDNEKDTISSPAAGHNAVGRIMYEG
jgi:hypothetical protein